MGLTQELFDETPSVDPERQAVMVREMAGKYPVRRGDSHRGGPRGRVGGRSGCDNQLEFEFALDRLLDGFEKLPRARLDIHQPQPTAAECRYHEGHP